MCRLHSAIAFFLFALMAWFAPVARAQANQVVVLNLHDTIQPISEEYVTRGLEQAAKLHAAAVLITIDTPGGLLDSTREMVRQILESPVPVILYVSPSGSRAASAGFFLLEAADIAAMAPGTNTGAAHPVAEGAPIDATMKQKIENDTTAFLRSYVARRSRNTDAAQDAVLNSKSYTEREAQQLHLIDLIAASTDELLAAVDGRTITRFNGASVTLHTRNAALLAVEPTVREQLLDYLMNPNLAVLILVLGGLLVYLEFNSPGTIVPGALGTLLILTALFALNLLPVRYTAVMLILAAFILMLLEAKFYSHGVLAASGILCLVFGALTLVAGPIPEMRVGVATAVSAGVAFGLITAFLVRIAFRAHRSKVLTGPTAMIGEVGVVQGPAIAPTEPADAPERLWPSGRPSAATDVTILVHGELWRAQSPVPLAVGEQVRVRGIHELTLEVERLAATAPQPQTPASHLV
jgi:membrane-bound serine protease (ClpP class)